MLEKIRNLSKLTRSFCHESSHGIKIYNIKQKMKIPLVLANPLYSSFYTCGPTVYDSAHIGHASTYVRLDILQRILRGYFGVNLITCMNITNIDDKIIKKSNDTGRSWKLIAEEYEEEFWQDLFSLNIKQPDIKFRVTDKIPEIIRFIEGIEQKGFTAISDDGSVLFKTSDYKNYGKLQNVVIDSSAANFALWKRAKPNEPSWDTKWGRGRPGWHIECSTLASHIFGSHLDFHAGGMDLQFPHHENEEAQSCVFHSVQEWVANWIHTGHLHMKGHSDKMSKSLKNTVSIRELLEEQSSDQFRVACLLSHYRSSIEFGPELMTAANSILKNVKTFRDDARAFISGVKGCGAVDEQELITAFTMCRNGINDALRDDFNTSRSIGCISEIMTIANKMINASSNKSQTSTGNEKSIIQGIVRYIEGILETFGVGAVGSSELADSIQMENLVNSIIKIRNEIRLKAKESKNNELYKVCDSIRDTLKDNKIEIKDHGNLSSWNRN